MNEGPKRGRCAQILERRKIEVCDFTPGSVIFGADHDVLEGWVLFEESDGEVVDTRHYLEVAYGRYMDGIEQVERFYGRGAETVDFERLEVRKFL